MNLAELRDLVSYIADFNEGQTNQDLRGPSTYPNKRIDMAINFSYKQECRLSQRNGSEEYFKRLATVTWPADADTLTIPSEIKQKQMLCIRDDSDGEPGPVIRIWDSMTNGSGLYVKDGDSWGWYPTPSSDRTLTIVYVAEPANLQEADDRPEILPDRHHELVAWSAAIWLLTVADKKAPEQWLMKQRELRLDLWKELTRGNPAQFPPKRIKNQYADTEIW